MSRGEPAFLWVFCCVRVRMCQWDRGSALRRLCGGDRSQTDAPGPAFPTMGKRQGGDAESSADFRSAGRVHEVAPMMANSPRSVRSAYRANQGPCFVPAPFPPCGPFPKFHISPLMARISSASAQVSFRPGTGLNRHVLAVRPMPEYQSGAYPLMVFGACNFLQ